MLMFNNPDAVVKQKKDLNTNLFQNTSNLCKSTSIFNVRTLFKVSFRDYNKRILSIIFLAL